MPSPPSTHPVHTHPLPLLHSTHRTSLAQWMSHHHLPFSALTISDPPPTSLSIRELVVVSAVVGRGMFGSARLELVVPRAEVRRVAEGEEKAEEGVGTGVEVREVRGDSADSVGLGYVRRESGASETSGSEGGWTGGDDGGVLGPLPLGPERPLPGPILRRRETPVETIPVLARRRATPPTALPTSQGGVLSVHCGSAFTASLTQHSDRPSSPTYLLPNFALPLPRPATPASPTCAKRLVTTLPLHPPRQTAHPPQQADFAFGPGASRKHARGWVLDAREMVGRVGDAEEMEGDWSWVVCGCKGMKGVACLGCGSPLGILIPSPCPTHALRSASPGSPRPGPTPVWFVPHLSASVRYPSKDAAAAGGRKSVGR